jgi:chromosomal replication initiator protein
MENFDLQKTWQTILDDIESQVSPANFVTWFKNTELLEVVDGSAVISVPNGFAKEWLENRFAHLLTSLFQKHATGIARFECRLSTAPSKLLRPQPKMVEKTPTMFSSSTTSYSQVGAKSADDKPSFTSHQSPLNPRYSFHNFIVAEHNELAHAAAKAIVGSLGNLYNPLFIYGGVGLGKTHLMQSVGNAVKKEDPTKKVVYISAERFTTELVESLRNGTMEQFKSHYQNLDLLIIDDIQFLAGREKTQHEFFHIFNSLYQLNKQILISSDRPPQSIATLEDRLRSRFQGGMIADISRPSLETRVAILSSKAEEKGVKLPEEALVYIAENIVHNVRELEGALNKIFAFCQLQHLTPTVALIKSILQDYLVKMQKNISPQDIIRITAEYFQVDGKLLLEPTRKQSIAFPRQIAMYLLRTELALPLNQIGDLFGGRDHTTVLHSVEKIESGKEGDKNTKTALHTIHERLQAFRSE